MPNKLAKRRHQACLNQSHRCFYCKFEMWECDPKGFATTHKISLRQAQFFKCTAEHLEARMDGGSDAPSNIVAACAFCNRTRHKIKNPPDPEEMRRYVEKRLAKGLWNASVFNRPAQHTRALRPCRC